MSTRTAGRVVRIDGRKIAAGLTQAGSFITTYLFIQAIGLEGATAFFVALGVEFLLTAAKHNVFAGRADALGGIAVGVDMLLNAGGLWPYMLRLDKTPTWSMLQTGLGLDGELRKLPALVLALVFGFLLSAGPHWFWRK